MHDIIHDTIHNTIHYTIVYIIKNIKIHSSCEIEYFVELHRTSHHVNPYAPYSQNHCLSSLI